MAKGGVPQTYEAFAIPVKLTFPRVQDSMACAFLKDKHSRDQERKMRGVFATSANVYRGKKRERVLARVCTCRCSSATVRWCQAGP
jgi:hypothetical protein